MDSHLFPPKTRPINILLHASHLSSAKHVFQALLDRGKTQWAFSRLEGSLHRGTLMAGTSKYLLLEKAKRIYKTTTLLRFQKLVLGRMNHRTPSGETSGSDEFFCFSHDAVLMPKSNLLYEVRVTIWFHGIWIQGALLKWQNSKKIRHLKWESSRNMGEHTNNKKNFQDKWESSVPFPPCVGSSLQTNHPPNPLLRSGPTAPRPHRPQALLRSCTSKSTVMKLELGQSACSWATKRLDKLSHTLNTDKVGPRIQLYMEL